MNNFVLLGSFVVFSIKFINIYDRKKFNYEKLSHYTCPIIVFG